MLGPALVCFDLLQARSGLIGFFPAWIMQVQSNQASRTAAYSVVMAEDGEDHIFIYVCAALMTGLLSVMWLCAAGGAR